MKKVVLLSLLLVSTSVFSMNEDKHGRIAHYGNLSKIGKQGYDQGFEGAQKQVGYRKIRDLITSWEKTEEYSNGFELGYLQGFFDRLYNKSQQKNK